MFPIKNERYRANDETESWEDELPLFLDPLDEEDYLLLSFDDTGKPVPEEDLDGDDIERVEFTIEKYFLDERILNSGRKDVWDTCRKLYNRYLNGMKASKATGSSAKRESAKADLAQLKNLLKEEQQFSSVARSSLLKLGERMAIKIASSSI
ncbi:MAG: hypothetical protein HRT88_14190 [Lentisphaeraceae bacterium]|nr:hypothetical protein [Lentisphaeraceae bacterium]